MSANPGWALGYIPTAGEWNGLWGMKCDADDARVVGALQAGHNLSDLQNTASARANLGLGSAATASIPAAALIGGTGAAFSSVSLGAGVTLSSGTLSVIYGTTSGTAAAGNDSRILNALPASVAAATYAPLISPALSGTPTAPTAAAGTGTTQIATTAFVTTEIGALTTGVSMVNGRGGAVTLTSSDITSALAFTPYSAANPAGYITASGAPVQSVAGRTGAVTLAVGDVTGAAPKASPTFTGTVILPAGSTSVQPAKFQAGSLLSIPVAHSMEWDGSALYLTNSSGTRGTVATQSWVQGLGYVTAATAPVTSVFGRTGAVTLGSSDVTTALGFTPYSAANPSGYQTAAQVSAVLPVAASTTPAMDGAAAAGAGTTYARADHVHPTDTSRYAASNPAGYQTAAQVSSAISAAAYSLPTASTTVLGGVKVDGTTVTVTAGVLSVTYGTTAGTAAQGNDSRITGALSAATAASTYAPLTSPALTGVPTVPTAAAGTSTTQAASTAFVTSALTSSATVSTTGGSTTLTAAQYGAPVLLVTGTLTSNSTLIVPNNGYWMVSNRTSGAFTVTVKTSAGSGVSVAQGYNQEIAADGTNVVVATTDFTAQTSVTTPTMDGTTATVGTGTTFARADHSHPSNSPSVSTVAALRSATTTTLPASRCVLLGYASTADGGQGTFVVKASDTTSADNGGTIIVDTSGRRWFRDASSLAPSVLWFGAKGDGVTDAVTAFEAAAAVAADVSIPSGSYHLSRRPDVHGKNIMWHLAQDATIVEGAGYLNGGLIRPNRINRQTWGTFNEGAVFAVSGLAGDTPAGVEGFTTDSQQASYTTRDGVAFYADNAVPPPVLTSSGTVTYTSTTCTSAAAADVTKLLVDMFVITRHSPFYSGRLVSWSGDGKTFTVSGWYAQGNTAAGQVPANGTGFDVIRGSAAWAANYNIFLTSDSYNGAGGPLGVGLEIGTWQNYAPFDPATQLPNMSGIDVVELGTYGSNNAYLQRGQHYYGYASAGARFSSFYIYDNASLANGPYAAPTYGFCCQAICAPFAYVPQGVQTWLVGNNGQMDIGNTSTGGQVGIDLHVLPDNPSSPRDYDIRIEGISNGSGGADLFIQGAAVVHAPGIVPNTSGSLNFGGPSAVWGNAWLTNINLLGGLTAATTVSAGGDITSSGGGLSVANNVKAGTGASGGGYLCHAGKTGAFGTNAFNLYWTGSQMQLWVDTTNLGVITTTSDARFKTDVTPITESGLGRVLQMKPVSFRYADKGIFRDDGVTREGFLAQDLLSVVPSSVENSTNPDQPMSVNSVPLVSVLVKAVQEMAARIEVLEAALNLPGARANGGSL